MSGKSRGSFHSGLKPRRMKSRVKRLTESEKRRRGRKKEGGREGAGKPDSQREGDWEGEEKRVPERLEGKTKQNREAIGTKRCRRGETNKAQSSHCFRTMDRAQPFTVKGEQQ